MDEFIKMAVASCVGVCVAVVVLGVVMSLFERGR